MTMENLTKIYDFVIFGASGFTGQFVIEEVAKASRREEQNGRVPITWAIAGRNDTKLKESLSIAEYEAGFSFGNVGFIKADVSDRQSIDGMTKQTKIILNCVGPYELYGKPIVESCIQNGASQLDLSGEPQYINEISRYDEEAREAGVHIISSCGFDCIPSDIGLCYLSKEFPGTLNSARGFITEKGKMAALHTGTMESNVLAMSTSKGKKSHRKTLPPADTPKYPLSKHYGLHKNADLTLWAMPFPAGEELITRSQRYISAKAHRPVVQFQGFLADKSPVRLALIAIGVVYFFCMSFFSLTRKLLLKYPNIMTAGVFSKQGPTRESLQQCGFSVTLVGEGWKDSCSSHDEHSNPPDHKLILELSGPDPGYRATSIMMVACAVTLLQEKETCSERGGVMSPGMAFFTTNIIDALIAGGISLKLKNI